MSLSLSLKKPVFGLAVLSLLVGGGVLARQHSAVLTAQGVPPSQPSITVSSPDPAGTDQWIRGTTHDITWTGTAPVSAVSIVLLKGDSEDPVSMPVINQPASGTYTWQIPVSLATGNDYRIKISGYNSAGAFLSSTAVDIDIIGGSITVTQPDGNTCTAGQTCTIAWTSSGLTSFGGLNLYLSNGSGSIGSLVFIAPRSKNDSPYVWNVPLTTSQGLHRIRVLDQSDVGNPIWGISNVFTVVAPPPPFVSIAKTGPASVIRGSGSVSYQLVVSNTGAVAAPSVALVDYYPYDYLSYVDATGATCVSSQGYPRAVYCELGTLNPEQSRTVTLRFTSSVVANCASATVTNAAQARINGSIVSTAFMNTTLTCPPPPPPSPPDAGIMNSGPASVVRGSGSIEYLLTASNAGQASIPNVTVTDQYSTQLVYQGTYYRDGDAPGVTCTQNVPYIITCNFGSLSLAQIKRVRLRFTAPVVDECVPVTLSNLATVRADGDVTPANNSSTTNTTITCPPPPSPPDVGIMKFGPQTAVRGSGSVFYTLQVMAGAVTAPNVTVIDTYPSQLTYQGVDSMFGGTITCVPATMAGTPVVSCNFGTMPAYRIWWVKLRFTASAVNTCTPVTMTNRAEVRVTGDVNQTNNHASVDTALTCPNQPPAINNINGPIARFTAQAGTWTINATDPEGQPMTYAVDFGDGTGKSAYQGSTFTHTYATAGTFGVRFYAKDGAGAEETFSGPFHVTVTQPSLAVSLDPSSPAPGSILIGQASPVSVLRFTNTTQSTQTISRLTLRLAGTAGSSDLAFVHLTNAAGLIVGVGIPSSAGLVTISNLSIAVPANSSLSLRAIAAIFANAQVGTTVRLTVPSAADVTADTPSGPSTVTGSFPVAGNAFTISR